MEYTFPYASILLLTTPNTNDSPSITRYSMKIPFRLSKSLAINVSMNLPHTYPCSIGSTFV